MGYTVDKKTGKIILVHAVTVSSKAVKQPETQQQQQRQQEAQQTAATLPAIPAASLSSARASAPGTFVFPVTGQKVRTVWHEGNVWFVANDVSACLGFARPEKAIIDHCNHAKTLKGPESGGLTSSPRGINIIPESDVYRLVMRSKLPAAEQFQAWVCEEVLPTIRKTGGYGGSPAPPPNPKPKISSSLKPCRYYCPEPKPSRRNWPKPNPRPIITTLLWTTGIFSRSRKRANCSACPPKNSRHSCATRKGRRTIGCSRALMAQTSPTSPLLTVV